MRWRLRSTYLLPGPPHLSDSRNPPRRFLIPRFQGLRSARSKSHLQWEGVELVELVSGFLFGFLEDKSQQKTGKNGAKMKITLCWYLFEIWVYLWMFSWSNVILWSYDMYLETLLDTNLLKGSQWMQWWDDRVTISGWILRQVEEIRDWVLGWSMDQSVQQKMDMRPCEKCPWGVGVMGWLGLIG